MNFNPIVFVAFLFSSGLVVCMLCYIRRTGAVLVWSLYASAFGGISAVLFPRVLGYELTSLNLEDDWLSAIALVPILWIVATLVLVNTNQHRVLKEEHDRSLLHLDILTHDIANMSTPVISYIDLLSHSENIGESEREVLSRVRSNLERMMTLITRVRHLNSRESCELNREIIVDLSSSIERSVAMMRMMSRQEIKIEVERNAEEKVITGALIEEVLISVYMEATEDMKQGSSTIRISSSRRTEDESDLLDIDVTSLGQSTMANEKEGMLGLKKSTPLRRYSKGIGLSLSECQRLLGMHGGIIKLRWQSIDGDVLARHFKISLRRAGRTQ